jgi:hypothetical protein
MALLKHIKKISLLAEEYSSIDFKFSEDTINMACEFLSNQKAVENSKQLPFRFLSAYTMIPINIFSKKIKQALDLAVKYCIKNLNISSRIAVFSDVSGSMYSEISNKSSVRYVDI